ncbi:MAG: HXXEE domain-containing protein [Pseudomonadota bacterium]
MKTTNPSILIIFIAFALLWIPFGQHVFLLDHWMKLGTFMAPMLMFFAFMFRDLNVPKLKDIKLLSAIMLILYIIHQFEEHWVDVYGNIYAFQGFLNITLTGFVGATNAGASIISKVDIFVINTSLVWLLGCLAIAQAPHHIFPSLCMAGIILINAISHIVSSAANASYNPGVLTSLVLFVPFALWYYRSLLRRRVASKLHIACSLLWAVIAHIIMILGLLSSNYFNVIESINYHVILILYSISPNLLFSKQVKQER